MRVRKRIRAFTKVWEAVQSSWPERVVLEFPRIYLIKRRERK
jgi:hypothetical protein